MMCPACSRMLDVQTRLFQSDVFDPSSDESVWKVSAADALLSDDFTARVIRDFGKAAELRPLGTDRPAARHVRMRWERGVMGVALAVIFVTLGLSTWWSTSESGGQLAAGNRRAENLTAADVTTPGSVEVPPTDNGIAPVNGSLRELSHDVATSAEPVETFQLSSVSHLWQESDLSRQAVSPLDLPMTRSIRPVANSLAGALNVIRRGWFLPQSDADAKPQAQRHRASGNSGLA
ncbi:MAG: hypothetical protein KDA60_15400 [Planctomycetales bacterium]|nr:hypothetical protein [Planctomycetales bacterium]